MGFWSLFEVASMPILEVLLVSVIGAIMATDYFNVLSGDARKSLNKVSARKLWHFKTTTSYRSNKQSESVLFYLLFVVLKFQPISLIECNVFADCFRGIYSLTYLC